MEKDEWWEQPAQKPLTKPLTDAFHLWDDSKTAKMENTETDDYFPEEDEEIDDEEIDEICDLIKSNQSETDFIGLMKGLVGIVLTATLIPILFPIISKMLASYEPGILMESILSLMPMIIPFLLILFIMGMMLKHLGRY